MKDITQNEFNEHIKACTKTLSSLSKEIEIAAQICISSLNKAGKILIIGNGGSTADTQHFAAKLVGSYKFLEKAYQLLNSIQIAPL